MQSANETREAYIDFQKKSIPIYLTQNYLSENVLESDEKEWMDAGQIRNTFLPAPEYRPLHSVQAGLAMRDFTNPEDPQGFYWGFIGSTDTHDGRPAVATYKEYEPNIAEMSAPIWVDLISKEYAISKGSSDPFSFIRRSSYNNGGGLAAVHSEGRNREAIWGAFQRKEIYATSGDRILLWFNMVGKEDSHIYPMGSKINLSVTPHFEVKALGDFTQLPSCPNFSMQALGPEKLASYCHNDCYNPSNIRKRITRIEVVRIRPQMFEGENIAKLIEDPWKVIPCNENEEGCVVDFTDTEYTEFKRDTIYYVRAIQEPTPAINAGNLQTQFDEDGNPIEITLCSEEGCPIKPIEERAWSSPIYVNYKN